VVHRRSGGRFACRASPGCLSLGLSGAPAGADTGATGGGGDDVSDTLRARWRAGCWRSGPARSLPHDVLDDDRITAAQQPCDSRVCTVTWHRPVRSIASRPGTVVSASTGEALRLGFAGLSGTGGVTQPITVRLG
jgi:hypothetical protein